MPLCFIIKILYIFPKNIEERWLIGNRALKLWHWIQQEHIQTICIPKVSGLHLGICKMEKVVYFWGVICLVARSSGTALCSTSRKDLLHPIWCSNFSIDFTLRNSSSMYQWWLCMNYRIDVFPITKTIFAYMSLWSFFYLSWKSVRISYTFSIFICQTYES